MVIPTRQRGFHIPVAHLNAQSAKNKLDISNHGALNINQGIIYPTKVV